jgi:hypothetical protein
MSAAREEARTIAAGAGNEAADQEAGLVEAYSIDCRCTGASTTVNLCDGQRARLCVVLDWAGEAVLAPRATIGGGWWKA